MTPDRALPDLIAHLRVQRPDLYRDLRRRYSEAFLAIEQDGVARIEDAVDGDVEDQIYELLRELRALR